ncbi:MAG TPA: HRDC domain-containing protein [Verrucomicrobiota bacterium]|nr:HRDC domain-containing protein [Verrucomicrobiota bacterium]
MAVERRLIEEGGQSLWTFCVEYLDGVQTGNLKYEVKVDYKEVLAPDQFIRFSKLRLLRKELADKEAVPPYAVFTNEQLARMARLEAPTASALEAIEGIGPAKMAKYGAAFLDALRAAARPKSNEKSGQSEGGHHGS